MPPSEYDDGVRGIAALTAAFGHVGQWESPARTVDG